MQETEETQVWSLGPEDPLKEGKATHSNVSTWRIPWTEDPGGLQSIGRRVGHDWSDWARIHGKQIEVTWFPRWRQDSPSTSWVPRVPRAFPVSHPLPRASTKWTLQNGNENFDSRLNSFQITAPTYLSGVPGQIAWPLSASTSPSVKWL